MISLFLALIMAVSLCVTPASAAEGVAGTVQNFTEWSVRLSENVANGFWRIIYGDSWREDELPDPGEAAAKYEEYLNGLQADIGTTTLIDGGYRYYLPVTSFGSGSEHITVAEWSYTAPWARGVFSSASTSAVVGFSFSMFTAPDNGHVKAGYDFVASDGVKIKSNSLSLMDRDITKGTTLSIFNTASEVGLNMTATKTGEFLTVEFCPYVDFTPLNGTSSLTGQDITIDSRAASVLGNLGIVGDNGEITKIQDNSTSLIDEFNKVYWNPVTNEQQSFSQYTYNYEDRSYNLTMEDGSTVKVVYGDENITINEGDTIYNVYYLSSDFGSGGSGSGDGSGSGGEVGDAVSGLLGGLGNILAGLIEGLLKMAAQAVEALGGLIDIFNGLVDMILGFFGGFTSFLGSMFPFLPEETFVILNFGLILLIAAAVIKKLFL